MRLHLRSVRAAAAARMNRSSALSLQTAGLVLRWREYGEVAQNGGGIMAVNQTQTFDAKAQRRAGSET